MDTGEIPVPENSDNSFLVPDSGGQETTETATITKLTDKELILKDEKGQTDQFKRKK